MSLYRFGDWQLDPQRAELTRDGCAPVALRRLSLRVLCHLLDHAPTLVSKVSLLDAVWGRQEVSESVVAQVIKELRQVLGDAAHAPHYIETRPRQGYRVLVAVERLPAPGPVDAPAMVAAAAPPQQPAPPSPLLTAPVRSLPLRLVTSLALLLLALLAAFWWENAGRGDTADPALRQAALRHDWRAVPPGALDWRLPDAYFAAEALMARGELAQVRALIARLREQHPEPLLRGWVDLIELRAQGRDVEALAQTEALLALAGTDITLQVLRAELEIQWRPATQQHPLPSAAEIPAERLLLLEAQRAGANGDPQQQAQKAQAAMALAATASPILHELAKVEWAKARARLGDGADAMRSLAEAEGALRAQGYPRLAVSVLLQRAALARRTGKGNLLAVELEAVDAGLAASGDLPMRAELTRQRGILLGVAGQHEVSLGLLESAASMFLELGDRQRASSALNASSGPLSRLGRVDEVPARLAEAQRLAALAGHAESEAAIAGNLSLFHWRRGEIGAAVDGMQRALAHFERADRADDIAQARHNLATLLREAGQLAAAEPLRNLSIAHARQAGLREDLATRLFARAEDLRARGELAAAADSLAESESTYRAIGDAISLRAIACLRGLWAEQAGRLDEARAALLQERLESHPTANQMACDTLEARVVAATEGVDSALADLARRQEAQQRSGQRLLVQGSRLLQAELLLDAGRGTAAWPLLETLRAESVQDGHAALERAVALAWWRSQLQRGDAAQQELAARQTEDLIRRYPDQSARIQALCLKARTHHGTIAKAARAECLREAEANGLAGRARLWLAEPVDLARDRAGGMPTARVHPGQAFPMSA